MTTKDAGPEQLLIRSIQFQLYGFVPAVSCLDFVRRAQREGKK